MKKSTDKYPAITEEYRQFITDMKARITAARLSAARAVNRDLILLYWDIGRAIADKQEKRGWGESVVEMVARDLKAAFPGYTGFSPQNLWRMLQFYRTHTEERFLAHVVRELTNKKTIKPNPEELSQVVREMVAAVPWGHHANVLARITEPTARLFYLRATARFGWSRNVLLNQISDKERCPGDQPSIGIILCAEKDDVEVEYALRTKANPIGVAAYQLQPKLPGALRGKLPTAKQLAEVVRAELERGR